MTFSEEPSVKSPVSNCTFSLASCLPFSVGSHQPCTFLCHPPVSWVSSFAFAVPAGQLWHIFPLPFSISLLTLPRPFVHTTLFSHTGLQHPSRAAPYPAVASLPALCPVAFLSSGVCSPPCGSRTHLAPLWECLCCTLGLRVPEVLGGHGASISGTAAVAVWEGGTPVLKLPGNDANDAEFKASPFCRWTYRD